MTIKSDTMVNRAANQIHLRKIMRAIMKNTVKNTHKKYRLRIFKS